MSFDFGTIFIRPMNEGSKWQASGCERKFFLEWKILDHV